MDFRLNSLAVVLIVIVAAVIGVASAAALRDSRLRNLWAALVALVFVCAALVAVVFDYSWIFTDSSRAVAEAVTLGAAVTGIVYAIRAPG